MVGTRNVFIYMGRGTKNGFYGTREMASAVRSASLSEDGV